MNAPSGAVRERKPIACDLSAIPADRREEHVLTAPELIRSAQFVQELPNGYAFRYINTGDRFMDLAHFVDCERRCCPFFGFEIQIEPESGDLWLKLTGREGVKEMFREDLTARNLLHRLS